jgi:hypothetical protein
MALRRLRCEVNDNSVVVVRSIDHGIGAVALLDWFRCAMCADLSQSWIMDEWDRDSLYGYREIEPTVIMRKSM